MKNCEIFEKGLCTGCTGLAELDWCGPKQCKYYERYKDKSGLEICKEILGIQEVINLGKTYNMNKQ